MSMTAQWWGWSGPVEEFEEWRDSLKSVNDTFSSAREALVVIAAVNTIVNAQGIDKKNRANRLFGERQPAPPSSEGALAEDSVVWCFAYSKCRDGRSAL